MDLLEFECPLCNGLFNAAVTDTEVTCPHCDETICLGSKDSSSSANVTLVAQPITTPAPIFPPGYKKPAADDLSAPLGTVSDASPPVIIDDDVDESGSDTESTPAPPTVPEESLPVVIVNGDGNESGGGTESTPASTTVLEESQPVVIINDDVDESGGGAESTPAPPAVPEESLPVVIINGDVDESGGGAESTPAPTAVPEESLPVVIINGDGNESGGGTGSTPAPPAVPEESQPVVIINDDVDESGGGAESTPAPTAVPEESQRVVIINDDVDETSVGHETDTAIENLLPPNFQLDDDQIETATDRQKIAEATVVIDVRVDAEPITVGRGINKRELRSRTPDEKSQFKRKKNVIIWGIGVLIIIVTMIVMLKLV
ncbi:MAG: hypothetical protein HN617_03030 [Planctomycetaceae bacterium]|nr:hypothetical protein [Planctomycetaceae bacterium]